MSSPHDKLFREAFGDPINAAGEIRCALPSAVLAELDLRSLTAVPGSFLDPAFADAHTDILFTTRFAGSDAFVYVLFEHKSSADHWVAFQLLRYMVRIWERCRQQDPARSHLPPIIPIVVHHNDAGWSSDPRFEDLVHAFANAHPDLTRFTPRFEFFIDDVSRASDDQLRARALNAFGVLALLFLRDARTPERLISAVPRWADLLNQLRAAPDGARALLVLLRYIARVVDREVWPQFRHVVEAALPEAKESIMTIADEWEQQGLQRGLQQGQRALLVHQLRAKFGDLASEVLQQLEAADQAAIERYAERLLTAGSVEEVFAN